MSQFPDSQLPTDFFSHQALTLSVELISVNNPGLADAIKKAIAQINTSSSSCADKNNSPAQKNVGEMYFNAQLLETLQAHTIGKIVSALTELGEQALQNRNLPPDYLTILRQLINDWVKLTEWVLKNSASNKPALH